MIPSYLRRDTTPEEREAVWAGVIALRERLGLTQEAFGRQVGVKRRIVINWEQRKQLPDSGRLKLLAELERANPPLEQIKDPIEEQKGTDASTLLSTHRR